MLGRYEPGPMMHPFFNIKIPRCEALKRSVGHAGATEWNLLPPAVWNIDTYLAFKNAQKLEMLRPQTVINLD